MRNCLIISFIIGVLSGFLAPTLSLGATESAPVIEENDTLNQYSSSATTVNYPKDIERLLVRRWYTGYDVEPFGKGLTEGLSVLGFWAPQYQLSPTPSDRPIPPFSFFAGAEKSFSKSHALRLTYGYTRAYNIGDRVTVADCSNRNTFTLDYLWNLSNYYRGYDPGRSWEWLATIGGGFGWNTNRLAPTRWFWQTEMGIQVRKTLSPRLSAFLEPYYLVSSQDYDFYNNEPNYDDAVGVKAGLILRVTPSFRTTPWYDFTHPSLYDNWFIQNLVGISASHNRGDRILCLSDYNYSLAVGHWFNPSWGFDFGFNTRQFLYDNLSRRQDLIQIEGILNVPAFWDKVSFNRFSATAHAGFELGSEREYIYKDRRYDAYMFEKGSTDNAPVKNLTGESFPVTRFQYYLTGALQLHYFFNDYAALIGETRMLMRRPSNFNMLYSLGMEFYTSSFERYSPWHGVKHHTTSSLNNVPNNWFFEMGFGFSKAANEGTFAWPASPMTEVAMGIQAGPFTSYRLKERIALHPLRSTGYTSFDNQLSLDYMYDVTSLLTGYAPNDRSFTMKAFAGPVYSASRMSLTDELVTNHSFGAEFGLQHIVRVNSNLELYAEPRYLALCNDFNDWTISTGLLYNFNKEKGHSKKKYYKETDEPMLYIQALAGSQLAYGFGYYTTNPNFCGDFTVGYPFSKVLAFQGTIFGEQVDQRFESGTLWGLRTEFSADILRMFWSQSHDRGWSWTTQAGTSFANFGNYSGLHIGPTIGTQFRRRFANSPCWFALQGRLQTITTSSISSVWTLQAGLHFEIPHH